MAMFNKGDVVWAKIRGYPWWPGVVARVFDNKDGEKIDPSQQEVLVNFIGENSHATVPIDKVAPFEKYYSEYANNMKKKKLLDSIQTAKKIINGETTYENERQRLDTFINKTTDKVVLKRRKSESNTNDENSESEMPELEPPSSELNNELESNKSSVNDRKEEIKKKMKIERTISLPEKNQPEKPRVTRSSNKDPSEKAQIDTKNTTTATTNNIIVSAITTNTLVINAGPTALQREKSEKDSVSKEQSGASRASSNALKPRRTNSKLQISESDEEMEEENTLVNKPVSARNQTPTISFEENIASLESVLKRSIIFLIDGTSLESREINYGVGKRSNEKINSSRETLPKLLTEVLTAYSLISGLLNVSKNLNLIFSNNIGKYFKLLEYLLHEKKFVSKHVIEIEDISKELTNRLLNEYFFYEDLYKNLQEEVLETKKRKENKPPTNGLQEERERNLRLKSSTVKENSNGIIKTKTQGGEMTSSAFSVGVYSDNSLGKKDRSRMGEIKLDLKKKNISNNINTNNIIAQSRSTGVEAFNAKKEVFSEEEENSSMENLKIKREDKNLEKLIKVEDPSLRKKICIKMARIIQERYSFDKQKSRDLTLKLELKVRSLNPDMRQEYRNKILAIFKILKTSSSLDIEKIVSEDLDFNEILNQVEKLEKNKIEEEILKDDTNGKDSSAKIDALTS